MLIYFLKSSSCLLILLLFYTLALEKEKMHKFNRFYLLGALALSFGIPLLTFTTIVEVETVAEVLPELFIPVEMQEPITEKPTNYLLYILGGVYGLGVLLFLVQFIKNCVQMGLKVRKNQKVQQYHIVHVLLRQAVIPHTFLKYIFLNKTDFENNKIPLEVLLHEEAHVVQKHSLDILFIELLQIVFWFNPLIYLAKHNIKLNHEFMADDAVLHHGVSTSDYGKILLDYSISNTGHQPHFTSSINYSSIKKRFSVMKKNTSKKSIWLRSLLLLPLITALVYGFSSQKTVEVVSNNNQKTPKEQKVSQNIEEGATEKMMQEYRKYIQNYQNAKKKVVWMGEYNRIVAIYDLMTAKQKASVIDHRTVIQQLQSKLSGTKRKKPTELEFDSWKNADKFAIWIDNKHVPNTELNKYTATDFVHYSGSFVYDNARSDKFPQEYQYHLYTKQGFENTFLKAGFNKYNSLLKKYNTAREAFLKSGKTDNSELRLLHTRLWKLYKQFTTQELKKYNPAKPKPYPYYKAKADKKAEKNSKDSQEVGISSEEMLKQVIRTNNTNISNSSLDENQDIVELYREKHKKYLDLTNKKPHYIHKSKKEKEAMEVLFSDLGGMYFRMSKTNKSKVKRPRPPHYPYMKFKKDGKTVYKKKEDLTEEDKKLLPPPPPLPPSNNSSPKIVEAKEEFYRKVEIYGKAVQSYTKKGEGNVKELQKTYKEVMDQYNKFKKLSKNNYPPPPPPPPSEKVKIGEKSTIPPPPPPVQKNPKTIAQNKQKTGYIDIKGKKHFYLKEKNGEIKYYNKWGVRVDKNGKELKGSQKSNAVILPNALKGKLKKGSSGSIYTRGATYFFNKDKGGNTIFYNRWGNVIDFAEIDKNKITKIKINPNLKNIKKRKDNKL